MAAPHITCEPCRDTGWVCENHPERPHDGPNGCGCGGAGMPCERCNPCGGIDQPPDISRLDFAVEVDARTPPRA